jgi:hypothetical protein
MKKPFRSLGWLGVVLGAGAMLGCPTDVPGNAEVLLINALDGEFYISSAVVWDPATDAAASENLIQGTIERLEGQRFSLPSELPENAELSLLVQNDMNPGGGGFNIRGLFADEVQSGEQVVFVLGRSSGVTVAGEINVAAP